MSELSPRIISGGSFTDSRGTLRFNNKLDLVDFRRFYIVKNAPNVVRAWQAHKNECKIFLPLSGSFTVVLVAVDDWENPSKDLPQSVFHLTAEEQTALFIPGGFANGFTSSGEDAELLIFSSSTLEESSEDDFRYDSSLWYNWNKKG
ncbi:MAG: hypothetical protein SCALA702_33770 [Melioribacteraceae bacterium]|nr:MAG: hypothetical protein SCALA702_33770 [Melioribacteraceae bacterium]